MQTPVAIVKQSYEAYARGDIDAIVDCVADHVDWECVAPLHVLYAGRRRTPAEVGKFFADIAHSDQIHSFVPWEFIEAGEHVVVLGKERASVKGSGKAFESEWVHVFTVREGKICRWRGFFNTAARLG
jgi:hypothetical protein